ncbi:MAG: tRNA pseudouridine(54/55) synthase Pus10, partial [Candidatus Korarchaeota archaeon]|nr:tRNA pseudouridine(54/55) synthase Pus10 [Candidatus Korarchaeota archaeon]
EDIDARMLGEGRPFAIEIKEPKKRLLDLERLQNTVNADADGKIEISNLRPADKDVVRKLKIGERAQKEYLVSIQFGDKITSGDLKLLAEKLKETVVKQQTPMRVLHRRADLIREKYIYDVTVNKLSPKK